jgi:putative transposase
MIKTFKYRLYPSQSQEKNLWLNLNIARHFYNMCIGERKWAYTLEQRSITKKAQLQQVKRYKATFAQAQQVHSHVLQVVAADVDKAYQAFFRRVKADQKAGYPRFKGHNGFDSFGFKEYGNGFKLEGRRLRVFGVGRIPVRWYRPIEGTIKTVRIIYKAGRWYACFSCEVESQLLPETGKVIGVDVGITSLISTSDGDKVDNPSHYPAGQKKLRTLQRKLARAKRGSKNRRKALKAVQRQQEHVANQRADFLHKLSYTLVKSYDGIALEDLTITNMVRNKHLSKSILDSGWGLFKQSLTYKAESAGRELCLVNPAYTSKTCSSCGAIFEGLKLSDRWVTCDCGLSLDRDHNAAINILSRAGCVTSVNGNVAPLSAPNGEGKGKRRSEAQTLHVQTCLG